ncbi:MAG TPA: MBL fold metallo-hydrolase [Rhodothermia bacterium]
MPFLALLFLLPGATMPSDTTTISRIADGVYVFLEHNTTDDWVDGNTTAILTDEGVFVVDAPSVRLSRKHLETIRSLTDKPVRYLVNTHWHNDHLLGNQVYKEANPDLQIIASSRTKEISDLRNPSVIAKYAGDFGDTLYADIVKAAETGRTADGEEMSEYDHSRAMKSFHQAQMDMPLIKETRYTPPTMTFDSSLNLELGGRRIEIKRMPGHTQGDAVVYLPDDKILITGDLVIHPVPYGFGPYFSSWIETLKALMAIDATTIVPGHGEILHSDDYLQLERELFSDLLDQARKAVLEGKTVEQFKAEIDVSRYREIMVGDDPDREWGFENYFLAPGIGRIFDDAKGAY